LVAPSLVPFGRTAKHLLARIVLWSI
jgi:hypothetical protein